MHNWDNLFHEHLHLYYKFCTMILQISSNLPELKMIDQCKIIIICQIYVWCLQWPVHPLQSCYLQLMKCKTLWKPKPHRIAKTKLAYVLCTKSPGLWLCFGLVSHYKCFLYWCLCLCAVCCHVTPTLTEWRVTRVTRGLWRVWRIAPSRADTMSGYSILLNRFKSKACRLQVYFLTHFAT